MLPLVNIFTRNAIKVPTSKPTPTESDYKHGFFQRYFFRRINDYNYQEISLESHYDIRGRNPKYDYNLYYTGRLNWHLTGNVFQKNSISIKISERSHLHIKNLFPVLNEFQLPEVNPIDNLYTEGNELYYKDKKEYIGEYHIHPTKGPMEGSTHSEKSHSKLYYTNEFPEITDMSYHNFIEDYNRSQECEEMASRARFPSQEAKLLWMEECKTGVKASTEPIGGNTPSSTSGGSASSPIGKSGY